jgi:hypothetical protein
VVAAGIGGRTKKIRVRRKNSAALLHGLSEYRIHAIVCEEILPGFFLKAGRFQRNLPVTSFR